MFPWVSEARDLSRSRGARGDLFDFLVGRSDGGPVLLPLVGTMSRQAVNLFVCFSPGRVIGRRLCRLHIGPRAPGRVMFYRGDSRDPARISETL